MAQRILIIGGVAGGATTAARLRRLDEKSEIILFERGKYISYANCGLPYYLGGVISERDNLFVQTPEAFGKRYHLDIRVENEVVSIDRNKKEVSVKKLSDNSLYTEKYDRLVLSPGAEPVMPPLPGIKNERIFSLRNVDDVDHIKSFVDNKKPSHALVVGAGFIGMEVAENLHERGIRVTIVEMAEQVMALCDYEMAAAIHQHLKTKNVEFYLGESVSSFSESNGKITASLSSKRTIETDMVVMSIGVRPESHLAKDCGLGLGERGAITVNEYLQTTDENIYALGDAIEFEHPILGTKMPTYLAGPANKQGRIVATNIIRGNSVKYNGSIGTAIAKVFDLTVGSSGLSSKFLKKAGINYDSVIIHGSSHAGYYPDALPMTLKITFNKESGKLYGAQIVGYEGVDKRIDMIAAVMRKDGSIYDLQEVEHAYAPPYSSAKDPVNMAGFVAENIITGMVKSVSPKDVLQGAHTDVLLLDVRNVEEVELGTIEGSINIPLDDIRDRMNELPKDKKIIVFCGVGLRGYLGARILMQNGYTEVYNLKGGYKTYEHLTHRQSNEDIFEGDVIGKDDLIYQADPEKGGVMSKKIEVDVCGLQCPGPIMRLKKEIENIEDGDILSIKATDQGFAKDVESWCRVTGNKLVSVTNEKGRITAEISKQKGKASQNVSTKDDKTLIVFSDDFDRALASFVIANGAASMGRKVTMFFTFWGLNVIKKPKKPSVVKDFMGKMFSMMLPSHSKKLKLSKMHMMGMGTSMMRMRMKAKNVDALEVMMKNALDSGIRLVACQMSMDMMGVDAKELLDGVEIGGVATYLEAAEDAGVNLFI